MLKTDLRVGIRVCDVGKPEFHNRLFYLNIIIDYLGIPMGPQWGLNGPYEPFRACWIRCWARKGCSTARKGARGMEVRIQISLGRVKIC